MKSSEMKLKKNNETNKQTNLFLFSSQSSLKAKKGTSVPAYNVHEIADPPGGQRVLRHIVFQQQQLHFFQ